MILRLSQKTRAVFLAGVFLSLALPLSGSDDAPLPIPSDVVDGRVIVVPSSEARNIGAAMAMARVGDTVRVRDGVYKDRRGIFVTPGVVFEAENLFGAVLDGRGRNIVVSMGGGSTISGFVIRNGTVGIFSAAPQAVIRNCRIMSNTQSGVVCVGVLPMMEDNFIVFNRESGIQGWDVRTTSGSINHNTIAFNGNHGISLGGSTSITVENNIIAFNGQFGVKPAEETVRVELTNNNFYQNARMSINMPADNISDDPLFADARRLDFSLSSGSRSIGAGTDNQNLGARILR
ncbi:MAG: right-handed parallel beta-helix repeat-containing protein [Chitinispirillales bacterium]|nr:right-handed parallel beta-helix repeat-containing protein [Chitinispirillales bacterium]